MTLVRRRALGGAAAAAALGLLGTAGAGWYFAGELLTVVHVPRYPVRVLALDGDEITLSRDVDTEKPIILGLTWDGGAAQVDGAVRVERDAVVRRVAKVFRGSPRPGIAVAVDYNVYDSDPATAFGLPFETVRVPGELGDLPAWRVDPMSPVPGRAGVWGVAVHGRGATRHEALRVLPTVAGAGVTTLVLGYRNDADAPPSPDGYYHLGDTEWRDVAAAVGYARAHGATDVVLFGWSMGGGTALTALRRMAPADAGLVRGAVLDSPTLSWDAVLDFQAAQRHLPPFLTWTAKRVAERRAGFRLSDVEQDPAELRVPVLIAVDESERHVRTDRAHAFAAARPDLVRLLVTTGGGHVASWNVDPARYETEVRTFLDGVLG